MRVLYAAQPTVAPPTFVLFTNVNAKLHFSYMRFLENRLREKYEFYGMPIRIVIRGRVSRSGEDRLAAKSSKAKSSKKNSKRANSAKSGRRRRSPANGEGGKGRER